MSEKKRSLLYAFSELKTKPMSELIKKKAKTTLREPLERWYVSYSEAKQILSPIERVETLEEDHKKQIEEIKQLEYEERQKFQQQNQRLREALQEISEGKGSYSLDPFEHCRNTVRDMKELAVEALKTE